VELDLSDSSRLPVRKPGSSLAGMIDAKTASNTLIGMMQVSDSFLRVASGVLCFIGGLAIVGNLSIAVRWYLFRKRASMIPLIGGVLLAVGLLICPVPGVRRWCWIPLILDLSVPSFLYAVFVDRCFKK
jgi:hypothetical protein